MAPKGGMAGFVNQKNAPPDSRRPGSPSAAQLNGLKVGQQITKEDKKQKAKRTSREISQAGQPGRYPDGVASRSNASSTDALSTTASTTRQKSNGNHHLQTRSHSYERKDLKDPSAAFGGTNDGVEHDDDEELPHDSLSAEDKYTSMLNESRGEKGGPSIAQTQIKGDSYPPTSAGIPSVTDQRERPEVKASGGLHNIPTHAADRTNFGRPHRPQQHATHVKQYAPPSYAQGQPDASTHQPYRAPVPDDPRSEYDISAGFSFGQALPVKMEVGIRPSHARDPPPKERPGTTDIRAPAVQHYKVQEPRPVQQPTPMADDRDQTTTRRPPNPGKVQRAPAVLEYPQHHDLLLDQHQLAEPPRPDGFVEEDPNEQLEHQELREDVLDYDEQVLYNKDFQTLKDESFDHRPNVQPFSIADLPDTATLPEKLSHMASVEAKVQAEFFASLGIDAWEEAGDWFLECFADTLKQLKNVRREKRNAARAFEDEVEQREVAVSKKRSLTNVAMGEMKTSGAAVLQGTPGKKK